MESLKKLKGYGKVEEENNSSHIEDQTQQRKPTKRLNVVVSISAILLLTLAIAFALAILIHHTNNEPPESTESPNSLNSSVTDSIRFVCNVTRFPDSCFTSISDSINTSAGAAAVAIADPKSILKLSLRISIDELTRLSSSSLAASKEPAMADCRDQVDDAVSRLNDSLSVVAKGGGGGGKGLTDSEIADVQTWVSAAVTDQQTCLDGMEEMQSPSSEMKRKMERCGEYTSNSLAIVANFKTLMNKFVPLH